VEPLVSQTKFPVSSSDVKIELPGATSGIFLDEGIEILQIDIPNRAVYLAGNWMNKRALENNAYSFSLRRANLRQPLRFVKLLHATIDSQASTKVVLADTVTSADLFNFVGPSGAPSVIGKANFSLIPQNINPPNTLSFNFSQEKVVNGTQFGANFAWTNSSAVIRNVLRWRAVPRVKRVTILDYEVLSGGQYSVLPTANVKSSWGSGESLSVQGSIDTVNVSNGGNVVGTPTLNAFYPGAYGASFSLGMSGSQVVSVTVISGGTGYNGTPVFSIIGATVISSPSFSALLKVSQIVTESRGYDYIETPTFSFAGGSGSGASVSVSLTVSNEGMVDFVRVEAGGTGYADKSALIVDGNAQGYVNVVDGSIVSAVLTDTGYGYTASPSVGVTGPGASASLVATVSLYADWNYVEIDPLFPAYSLTGLNKHSEYEWQVYSATKKKQDLNSFSPSLKFKFF
jgi:hypothetical protein